MPNEKYERNEGTKLPNNEEIKEINQRKGQKYLRGQKAERVEDWKLKKKLEKNSYED